jgi:hypothetical protein
MQPGAYACAEKKKRSQACWHMPVIPTLGRLRQEDHKFKASLGYIARL